MSLRKTLFSRFTNEQINNAKTRRYYLLMERGFNAAEAVEAKRKELSNSGKLTPEGIRDEVRAFAAKTTVPELTKVKLEVEACEREIAAARTKLSVPKPDATDVAGAMLRVEWRTYLRSLKPAEVVKLLMGDNADPRALEAAFEVPAAMIGLPQEARDQIEAAYIEATHGSAMAAIADEAECAKMAGIAVKHGVDVLRRDGEFPDTGTEFDSFMGEASAEVEAQIDNGTAKRAPLDVEWLAEHIAGLPFEDRHRVIDHALEQNWSDVDKMGKPAEAA